MSENMDLPELSIPEYFKDKEIFITGGSGFLGKVLIEKLLRSCPDIKKMYLLVRERKGMTPDERVQQLLNNELFDKLKQSNPDALKKLVAIAGDVSELKLGMSEEDRVRLRGVHVVFHVAASVRFDDPLKKATLMNTRGTREVMELMLEMSCLQVGVHVSTTYCNTDKDVIEERVYRDHGDWREAIRIAENYEDDHKVACLTGLYKSGLRNTYTFTKHLAENVVEDYCDRLPLIIYRPGVVVSMWKDPIPGWVDNVNGPIGLTLAIGKGLLRTVKADANAAVDNIPVDVVVKSLIISTWQRGIKVTANEKLPVYNCSVQGNYELSHKHLCKTSMNVLKKNPFNESLWFPCCHYIANDYLFQLMFLIFNALPALIFDVLLKASGRKPIVTKMVRKAYFAMLSVSYFIERNWDFKCDKHWALNDALKPCDKEAFDFSVESVDLDEFLTNARFGTSNFIMKETVDIPLALQSYKRQKILHYLIKALFYGGAIYFLYTRYFTSLIGLVQL